MMGLFPNAGQSYYLLNTPYFDSLTLHQENGEDFTISAQGLSEDNQRIQSATLNGRELDRAWLEHAEIVAGGELVFRMGATASNWGTVNLPPSKSFDPQIVNL